MPKRRTSARDGGYRRFRSEFPATPRESWPWLVEAREGEDVWLEPLDLRE